MSLHALSPTAWLLLLLGAVLVGIAKTALSGVGALAVVAFAAAVPAKESTGALLPLLLVGDVIAIRTYHRHADWKVLAKVLPGVLPGIVLGTWFLSVADDSEVKRSIGVLALVMCGLQLWSRHRAAARPAGAPSDVHVGGATSLGFGAAAGFATMTANAAGPVTTLYLMRTGLPMLTMLGTTAWFYFLVNAMKVPFSAGASLITLDSLVVDAVLVPGILVGAVLGIALIRRIDQAKFETALLTVTVVAAALLLV